MENPNPSTFQNYSDQKFTNPNRNNTAPSVPQNYNNNVRTPQSYQHDIKKAQEDIRRFEQEQAEAERAVRFSISLGIQNVMRNFTAYNFFHK